MFTKEYLFETRWTKARRGFFNLILFCLFLVAALITLCFWIPYFAESKTEEAKNFFYGRAPDLIAVFTGDQGRIPEAVKLGNRYPNTKILISGVYAQNNLNTLYQKQLEQVESLKFPEVVQEQSHKVELDYTAKNTVENVLSTLQFLRKNSGVKDVLVLSHDYHILRIFLIFQKLQREDEEFNFRFIGLRSDYGKLRNQKLLLKEVVKLAKASAFLLLWDAG